uniref:Uncharacterized protein MANES_05G109900 n=1 Tax=Rhizophora mucronata TaxID=61149 RepID=A0A2P2LEB6_RHIMU
MQRKANYQRLAG